MIVDIDTTEAIRGAVAIIVAGLGAGVWTKRSVKRSVVDAVATHGDDEMAHLEAIKHELTLMRESQNASNQLHAQMAATQARRLELVERRLEALERV